MLPPSVFIQSRLDGTRFARLFPRRVATEGLVNTTFVVIQPEVLQLPLQVQGVSEQDVIQMLAANCADQAFGERVR